MAAGVADQRPRGEWDHRPIDAHAFWTNITHANTIEPRRNPHEPLHRAGATVGFGRLAPFSSLLVILGGLGAAAADTPARRTVVAGSY